MIGETIQVKGREFKIVEFLGKGKSGYSYLIDSGDVRYVLKKIHYEPCSYYRFGDKLKAEIAAYDVLKNTGIGIPELAEVNQEEQYLIKEFIKGVTAARFIADGRITNKEVDIVSGLAKIAYSAGINIDYFPTNFIIMDDSRIVYIDYEFNQYSDEWNFENWGIYYWMNSTGMKEYLETGNILAINIDANSGKPIRH